MSYAYSRGKVRRLSDKDPICHIHSYHHVCGGSGDLLWHDSQRCDPHQPHARRSLPHEVCLVRTQGTVHLLLMKILAYQNKPLDFHLILTKLIREISICSILSSVHQLVGSCSKALQI